jgi:hypothetical protein
MLKTRLLADRLQHSATAVRVRGQDRRSCAQVVRP